MSARRPSAIAGPPAGGLLLLLLGSLAGCIDAALDRPASFSYIHAAILQPACATSACHSELTATLDISLQDRDEAYDALVDGGFVFGGQPERSKLLYLLRAIEVRKPMPPDSPLPDGDIELIERWIADGAEDN
jgi:hypothetical protein